MKSLRLVASSLATAALLASCSSSTGGTPTQSAQGPKPEISAILPGKSPLEGGGYAVVKGLGFKSGLTVTVGGAAVPVAQVYFVDRQTFSFKVPAGRVPGGVDVAVKNTDSSASTYAAGINYEATTNPPPQIGKVTPNSGPVTGGTYSKIEGQNFLEGALVLVGGAPASIVTVLTPGLLSARFSASIAGAGTANLIVTNPDGQSGVLGDGFAFADLGTAAGPQLSAVVPDEGPVAGGNKALVKVDKLGTGGQLFVAGQPTPFETATGGIQAVMPPASKHGLVDVAVTNAGGQSDVLPDAYNYIQTKLTVPPTLSRVTPNRGLPVGGGRVIIEGEGFQAAATALIGNAPCTDPVVAPPRALTCIVPPGALGSVDVTVQNDDGGLATFAKGFSYGASTLPAPAVNGVSPNTGPRTGGTVAAVTGSNFVPGGVVIIGGRPAGSVVGVDANLITARFPALPPGAADVVVTNPDGQSGKLASGFTVAATVNPPSPRVNSISPAAGPLEGGEAAVISGEGFSAGARVFIGGRPAAATTQGGSLVVLIPPNPSPGLADIAVTNNDGQSDVLPGGFNYFSGPPVITSLSTSCGPVAGNTAVTIFGRNFKPGVGATIGGKPLSGFSRPDPSTIQGTTTTNAAGGVDVVVTNPDGQLDTLAGGFNFTDSTHPCPGGTAGRFVLTRVIPGSGPSTGNIVVTLVGEGFVSGAQVKFGDIPATDVKLLGPGALVCALPLSTKLGPVDVTVTLPLPDGRGGKLTGAFNYFDPNSNYPAPVVSAVAPNAGPNTGNSVVQLTGSGFLPNARAFFGAVEAQLPTLVDGTRMIAVTPNSLSGPVDVTVLNPDGKSGTLAFGFAFYPVGAAGAAPLAQRVDPRNGSTQGPTVVSVKGSGFQPGALVFFGNQPAVNVQLGGDGSLGATVAAQAPGTVDVIVTNPDGQSSTISQGFTFQAPAPKLSAIAPASGPLAGGTTAVVSGSGFAKGDLIGFGGTLAAVKVLDDTAVFATVPAHDAGIVNVTLVRSGAVVDTLNAAFTYDPNYQISLPPAIASLEPSTGPFSGGTVLWLTGSNLGAGAKVYFGANLAAKVVRADSGHLVVTAPPGSAAGFVDVNIVNTDGQAGALLRGFSYVADALLSGLGPKLTSVTPDKGPESTDTTAILTGRNFVAGELMFVGSARGAGVRLLSTSILSTTLPHQPAGAVDLSITHPDGRSSTLPNGFTFLARPTLVSVANTNNPAAGLSGPTAGGTAVTIAGTGFQQGATVTFSRAPATAVSVKSDSILTAVTPNGLAGPADVQLINPDGQTAVLAGGWLYVSPPKATGLTPPGGPLAGGTYAVLAGADFSPQAVVTVGGVQATTYFGSSASLVIVTPAGATAAAADVQVRNPDGQTSTLTGSFTYSTGPFGPAPTLASISPSTGPDTGGTFVAINGSNYRVGAIGIVGGSLLGRNLVAGPGAITGLTGPGKPGLALVAVTNADGVSATLPSGFTYSDHTTLGLPPVVDHAVPNTALAPGGATASVLGGSFSTLTPPLVFMQGIPTSLGAGSTANQINVITPAAQPGPADIAVVNPDGQTSIKTNAFTFLVPPPVLASLNPLSPVKGPIAGGTVVTILGSYFQPPVQVFFGNAPGVINSDPAKTNANQITVTTPPGVAGNVAVLVQNKDGQSASLPGAYYYQPPPVLFNVSPTSGGPDGGYSVTLNGQYFSGTASTIHVKFGAAVAAIRSGTTPSSSVIEVVVPPSGSAGGSLNIAVTITNDDGQSVTVPGAFYYLPPPAPPKVLGVTPNSGQQQGGNPTTVLGTHFQFGARVFFGDAACLTDPTCTCPSSRCQESSSVNVTSDSALSCQVPAASGSAFPKTVFVRVRNPDTNEDTLPASYTYVSGPAPSILKILALAPNTGISTGGTVIFIGGTGFQVGATAALVPHDASLCASGPGICDLLNVQVLGPTAMQATMPAQPVAAVLYDLVVKNPGVASSDQMPSAWTYGAGTRRFVNTGSRMPAEMHNNKYSRGISNRYTPGWTGTIGPFTRQQAGRSDVFLAGWAGRNPRLYQGQCESNDTDCSPKTRRFVDFSQNLRNPNGTPVKDNCCGSSNPAPGTYYSFLPRNMDLDGNGLPEPMFWDDYNNAFTIFWNVDNILTARQYGGAPSTNPTDWFGGFDPASGAIIDFNLDGAPDFVFVADNVSWVGLSCGGSRPDPQGGNNPVPAPASIGCVMYSTPPSVNKVVTVPPVSPQTPVSVTVLGTETASFNNTNFAAFMPPGSRWIADNGVNAEIITITNSTTTPTPSFTANYYNSHGSGFQLAPVIETIARTNVTATGTTTQVVVDDMRGFGSTNIGLVADYGTPQEERVSVYCCAAFDYVNKKVTINFNKTHTQPFTLSVRDPHSYVFDAGRFSEVGLAYSVVAGDVSGKGHTDVIVGNENGGVKLFFNNSLDLKTRNKDPMGFSLVTSPTVMSNSFPGGVTSGNVRALALVDLNGDTLPDLLVGYRDNQHEKLFLNRGNGVFVDEGTSVVPSGGCNNPGQQGRLPPGISDSIVRYDVRDIDGNGKPDVLAWIDVRNVTNTFPKYLRTWLNDGKGCFAGEGDWTSGGASDQLLRPDFGILHTWQYAFGDFNGDGFPDMIAALDQVQSREYVNYNGSFVDKTVNNLPESTSSTDPAQTSNVWWRYTMAGILVDANGDGFPDLITSQYNTIPFQCGSSQRTCDPDGSIHLFLNDRKGNFPHDDSLNWLPTRTIQGKITSALPIASWAMDSAPLSNQPNAPLAVIIASATQYTAPRPPVLQGTIYDTTIGAHRLLVSTNHGPFVDLTNPYLPTGGEAFTVASSVKFVDLDQDGYQDIVIGDAYNGGIMVWKGTPGGYFINVTNTAVPGGVVGQSYYNRVAQIVAANFDGDNFNLPDLFLVRDTTGSRLLINHSDPVNHTILLVDETTVYAGQPLQRLPNPPNAQSAAVGAFSSLSCSGTGIDLYVLDTSGAEHLYTNGSCPGSSCGFFQDNTNFILPASSKGSQCIGYDCGGNVHALTMKYSGNDDILIARNSDNGTTRPHRLLKNNCGTFTDVTLAAWAPMPLVDDKIHDARGAFYPGAISGDIFGHAQAGDGNGTVQDLIIFNLYGPRLYRNSP